MKRKVKKALTIVWIAVGLLLYVFLSISMIVYTNDVIQSMITTTLLLIFWFELLFVLYNIKDMFIVVLILLGLSILDYSTINFFVITFVVNTIYIKLFAEYKWDDKKVKLQEVLKAKDAKKEYAFDSSFFERIKKQEFAIFTLLIQSVTVMPAAVMKVLIDQKSNIFKLLPIVETWYVKYLSMFKCDTYTLLELKRLLVAVPILFMFMLADIVILLICKQVRDNKKELKNRRNRNKSYWGDISFGVDGDDWVYIIKNPDYKPAKVPSLNGEKCVFNGKHEEYEIECDECSSFQICYPATKENN